MYPRDKQQLLSDWNNNWWEFIRLVLDEIISQEGGSWSLQPRTEADELHFLRLRFWFYDHETEFLPIWRSFIDRIGLEPKGFLCPPPEFSQEEILEITRAENPFRSFYQAPDLYQFAAYFGARIGEPCWGATSREVGARLNIARNLGFAANCCADWAQGFCISQYKRSDSGQYLINKKMKTYPEYQVNLVRKWSDKFCELTNNNLLDEIFADGDAALSLQPRTISDERRYLRLRSWFVANEAKFLSTWTNFINQTGIGLQHFLARNPNFKPEYLIDIKNIVNPFRCYYEAPDLSKFVEYFGVRVGQPDCLPGNEDICIRKERVYSAFYRFDTITGALAFCLNWMRRDFGDLDLG